MSNPLTVVMIDLLVYDLPQESSAIFDCVRESSEIVGKCSETFVLPSENFLENLRKCLGSGRNLRKMVKNVGISLFI